MSIFGSMKTAVSGMNAQANRLSTVSDNIANTNTVGYKSASTSFSSLVLPSTSGNYSSGSVQTSVQYAISHQGDISYTTDTNNLAIKGDGFFVVQDPSGGTFLTRAGDFTPDANGNLVNSAGFTLMGYSYATGSPSVVVNGFTGMVPVNVGDQGVQAVPSSAGDLEGVLDSNAEPVTDPAALPSANPDAATVTSNTSYVSVIGVDSQGNTVKYDVYYTKTADNTWDVAVYDAAGATTGGTSAFPYASPPVASGTMVFDDNGQLTESGTITPTQGLTFANGAGTIDLSMSNFQQLGTDFSVTGKLNGQAPNPVTGVTIDKGGVVSAQYKDGTAKPLYRIPLATVEAPDKLTPLSGNVYSANGQSGVTVTGFPQTGQLGYIQSGAVEESNVDLAGELTEMIEAQKNYTANSKVFQAGSNLLDVLVNLQR